MVDQPSTGERYVFISYASPDRERAVALADALTAAGVRAWLDQRDIVAGSNWDEAIVLAIRNCSVMAVLCSRVAMESPNIVQELRLAQQHRKPVLPLLLEAVTYPPAVEYILAGRQWVELAAQPPDAWLPNVLRGLEGLGLAPAMPAAPAVPSAPTGAPRTNLPRSLTSFVGREREIHELTSLLTATRLLTLTGPGGVGKTRLAVELARAVAQHFTDGAVFVALAPVSDPALVPARIAQALGVQAAEGEEVAETLAAFLHEKDLLLVLDNFEQVVDAAPQIAELIASTRLVQAIVTSRVALHVRGEQEYAVPPLAPPDAGGTVALAALAANPSVQLFTQRAKVANPGFTVHDGNARAVGEICRRLDGLPLAIELAAARIKVLSPQAMLTRLQNRLELLRGGARDLPVRQQALRTAIDWSYDLLEPAERMLFARLAVFVGGCTLAAAEEVCRPPDRADVDVLDGLASLVDKSLALRHERADGEDRFTLFETIREYALERLEESGEAHAIRRQHATYFLAFAETVMRDVLGHRQPSWLSRLEEEHDNLRAALQWFEESGWLDELAQLAHLLSDFWMLRGHLVEARARMARVLQSPAVAGRTALRAQCLVIAGGLAYHHLNIAVSLQLYAEALGIQEELGINDEQDVLLHVLGTAAHHMNDPVAGRSYLERSYALREQRNDTRGMAQTLNDLANIAHEQRDFARARSLFEQCLAIYRSLDGNGVWVALVLNNLAILAQDEGDLDRARALLEESVAVHREVGEPRGLALALANLARVTVMQGECSQAESLLAEALRLQDESGDRAGVAFVLDRFAMVAGVRGQAERCLRLAGAAGAIRDGLGVTPTAKARAWLEQQLGPARQLLGAAASEAAWEAGRALSPDQAVAFALAIPATEEPSED